MASQTTCAVSIQDRSNGERQPIVCPSPRPGPPMVRAIDRSMAGWLAPAHHSCRVSFGRENPSEQDRYRAPRAVASTNNSWVRAQLDPSSRPADLHCIERTGRDGMADAVRSRQVWYVCHGPAGGGGGDGDGEVVRGRQRRRAAQRRQARRLVYSRVPVAAAWARHHRIASPARLLGMGAGRVGVCTARTRTDLAVEILFVWLVLVGTP